jgi:WD40 repeat protein
MSDDGDSAAKESRVLALLARWENARAEGKSIPPEEICRDCPELLEEFRRRAGQLGAPGAPNDTPGTLTRTGLGDGRTLPGAPQPSNDSWVGDASWPELPGYEVLGVLGRGGMGVVFRARQLALKRTVALKAILAGAYSGGSQRQRFRVEAEAAAGLQHPNIVQIYEVGEHNGLPYYSMECVDGGTLAQRLDGTPMPSHQAAALVQILAQAVEAAHRQGVIHRDLKPSNVLLTIEGVPKIADFGLAKRLDAETNQTQSGAMIGTPSYMAPEQAFCKAGQVGTAADVYALGAILYECLTGRAPFKAHSTMETVWQVLSEPPVPPRQFRPSVSRDLQTICLKCLEKIPEERYLHAADLADDLGRFCRDEPIRARPVAAAERLWRWCRRNPAIAGLLATLVLLLVGVAVGASLAAANFRALAARERDAALAAASARESAEKARETEQIAHRRADAAVIDLHTGFGLLAAEHQDPCQAVLWFANAARLSQGDSEREFANRIRATTYQRDTIRPVRALAHDGQTIFAMAFHPAGRHLLTVTVDNQCAIWDVDMEQKLALPGGERPLSSAAWSPDGRWLALGAPGGLVQVYEFPSGALVREWSEPTAIRLLTFRPDGRFLAYACGDSLRVWDCRGQQLLPGALKHPKGIIALRFAEDGKSLTTACRDGRGRLFQLKPDEAGVALKQEFPHRWTVNEADYNSGRAWAPLVTQDGRRVFAVNDDEALAERDAETGKQRRRIHTRDSDLLAHSIALDPGHRLMAFGYYEGARLWNRETSEPVGPALVHRNNVLSMTFIESGTTLVTTSSDGGMRLWSTSDGRLLYHEVKHQSPVQLLAPCAGAHLLATAQEGGLVRVYAVPEPNPADRQFAGGFSSRAALSADGKFLMATGTAFKNSGLDATRVYDLAAGKPAGPPLHSQGIILGACFAPDTTRAALISSKYQNPEARRRHLGDADGGGGRLECWDWRTGQPLFAPVDMPGEPRGLAYSPDGNELAVFCTGGHVVLLDAATGKTIARMLESYADKVGSNASFYFNNGALRYTPDGSAVVTWGMDRCVRVWERGTKRLRYPPLAHQSQRSYDVQVSPDGRLLLSASLDYEVRIWNVATGNLAGAPLRHPDRVFTAKMSPDGRRIITACRDGSARIWNWSQGTLSCPPMLARDEVFDAAFSPDGRWAFTAARDQTLRAWDAATGRAVAPPWSLNGVGIQVAITPDSRDAIAAGLNSTIHAFDLGDLERPRDIDVNEQCTQAEVLSGQRIHEGVGVVKLTADEWLARWRSLPRPRLPQVSEPHLPRPAL